MKKKKEYKTPLLNEKGQTLKEWLYSEFWEKKPRMSSISGNFLGGTFSTVYYHHILPKNIYPELTFKEDNIIILTWDEHQNVENSMYKYEKINQLRIKLLEKYGTI